MWQVLTLALLLSEGDAPAPRAPAPGSDALPKNALAFNVGFASAVGVVGVPYMVTPMAPLELELGWGAGYSGLQLSFMPKLSFGTRNHRVTTGIGIASTVAASDVTRGHPSWLNADILGYEFRSDGHFFFAAAVGLYKGLGGGGVCQGDCEGGNQYATDVTKLVGFQSRVMIGAAF